MYHTIEFHDDFVIDIEVSPKQRLEQMLIHKGSRMQAQLKPHVVEANEGPVEVADIFFVDGTIARSVPFERFTFVDTDSKS